MKKLLALVLCVMMFVSVMSTSAFAATYDTTDQRTWAGASQQKKIVDALRTNIESIYGSYAVDTAVFNSIKTIDGILKDLVDGALTDYATSRFNAKNNEGLISSSTLNDAILAGLRSTIGGEISDYLNKHYNEYYKYDSTGHRVFDPSAYAGVYAKAASGALTSEKAVAGIQAYMLYAMQRSAFNSVANMANDLRNDINGWENWSKYGFGDNVSAERGIHDWNVPGYDLDGVLHNINPNYNSILSALGQLGVDLNQDDFYDLGYNGWVKTVEGNLEKSLADTDERVNSALLTNLESNYWNSKEKKLDKTITGVVYEGTTGTYFTDLNGDKVYESLDNDGKSFHGRVATKFDDDGNPTKFEDTPYFMWSGDDAIGAKGWNNNLNELYNEAYGNWGNDNEVAFNYTDGYFEWLDNFNK